MDARYLKKYELIHEIKSRNFDLLGTEETAELRSIFRQLVNTKVSVSAKKIDLDENNLKEIRTTLEEIEGLVTQYPGKDAKVSFRRVESRLAHVMGRLGVIEETDKDVAILKGLNEAAITLKARLDGKAKALIKAMSSTFLGEGHKSAGKSGSESEGSSVIMSDSDYDMPSMIRRPSVKPNTSKEEPVCVTRVPVCKWDIKFTGSEKPEQLMSFLERVEELRVARNLTKPNLYLSAIDLFAGNAISWFRSIKTRVCGWDELVQLLKREFLPPDFDDMVWEEIRNRKQIKGEKVSIYIAIMENLFSRLSVLPDEQTRLRYIRRNLLPVFIARLSLVDVQSIQALGSLCRKIEASLASSSKVATVAQVSESNKDINCWNCSKGGHKFFDCKKPRVKRFCFKCGNPEQTTRTCRRCSKN